MKELDNVSLNLNKSEKELFDIIEIIAGDCIDAAHTVCDDLYVSDQSVNMQSVKERYNELLERLQREQAQMISGVPEHNRVLISCIADSVLDIVKSEIGQNVIGNKENNYVLFPAYTISDMPSSVAICRNNYVQKALDIFSKKLGEVEMLECMDFSSMCELMDDQECDFCIMPYSTSDGSRIETFTRLRLLNELFICDICSIENEDEDEMSFVLLSSYPMQIGCADTLSLYAVVGDRLSNLIRICEYCGAKLKNCYNVDSMLSSADGVYELFLDCKNIDIRKLVCCLELEFPRYKFTGMYKKY